MLCHDRDNTNPLKRENVLHHAIAKNSTCRTQFEGTTIKLSL